MKKYSPVGNRLLIEKITIKEEKTKSGLIIPLDETNHMDREKQTIGIINSIGSGVDKKLGFKQGHKIKYAKHSNIDLDEKFSIVQDKDIQVIIYDGEEK